MGMRAARAAPVPIRVRSKAAKQAGQGYYNRSHVHTSAIGLTARGVCQAAISGIRTRLDRRSPDGFSLRAFKRPLLPCRRDVARALAARQEVLESAAGRWLARRKLAAWRTWHAWTARRQGQRESLQRALVRLGALQLGCCFLAWRRVLAREVPPAPPSRRVDQPRQARRSALFVLVPLHNDRPWGRTRSIFGPPV